MSGRPRGLALAFALGGVLASALSFGFVEIVGRVRDIGPAIAGDSRAMSLISLLANGLLLGALLVERRTRKARGATRER